jgi:molybdate transport system substrate-binding protein
MKLLSVFLSLILALSAQAAQLTVHAAASLTDAMKEISAAYEKQSGDQLRLNFDASSILARQIEEGAPADIFLSADEAKMDQLEKAGRLAPGTRKTLLSNTLVIVVPAESALSFRSAADLSRPQIKKIALAQPGSVPAGIYAKEYLTAQGLWDKIEPKVIPTQNVRAALAAVESGNVEAGIVYKTDALISKKVKVACEIPASEGPKISYPVAALAGSGDLVAAKKFLAYLESEPALAVFRKFGFTVAH